jgi:hypothetical protein
MVLSLTTLTGQIGINNLGSPPDSSAMVDVSATDKGVLIPRMTFAQRIAIPSPATGLLVFQTGQQDSLLYFDGSTWLLLNDQLTGFPFFEPRDIYWAGFWPGVPVLSGPSVNDYMSFGNHGYQAPVFGFSTVIVRDSIMIIKFDDTSNSASFPNNDWEIRFNDPDGFGSRNAFIIVDAAPGPLEEVFTLEAGAGDDAFYIDNTGNLGLGTGAPTESLHVNGNMHAEGDINATGTIMQVSDARLKSNIRPIINGDDIIRQLKPVQYDFIDENWLPDNKEKQYGLIAQEVGVVIPELLGNQISGTINGSQFDDINTVNYLGLLPLMVETLQQRQKQIDEFNTEIAEKEKIIERLKILEEKYELLQSMFYDDQGNLNIDAVEALRNSNEHSKSN